MFDWLDEIFTKVQTIIQAAGDALLGLVDRLNAIEFNSDSVINTVIGTIKYMIGEPLFLLMYTMLMIGAGLLLYMLIRSLISSIASLIPKLKNKLPTG